MQQQQQLMPTTATTADATTATTADAKTITTRTADGNSNNNS